MGSEVEFAAAEKDAGAVVFETLEAASLGFDGRSPLRKLRKPDATPKLA